ncbi:MAG: lysophospholipid acyltransferase family protein [Myxococcota bacterium]
MNPATEQLLIDHRGAQQRRSTWRTYLVLAHTLSHSGRIVGRSLLQRLSPQAADRVMRAWSDHVFDIAKLTLAVRGAEDLEQERSYVLLSNHASLLDIPCVLRAFPGRLRFVAKAELRRVPVFGDAAADIGCIFVDRSDRARAIAQLEEGKRVVADGTSLWVAAEGTRSRDGRLHGFKKGGFHVALSLGVPIVPVWIEGTLDVIPPDQWGAVTGQRVTVSFGAPIETAGRTTADLDALMQATRASMLALAHGAGARDDVDAEAHPVPKQSS